MGLGFTQADAASVLTLLRAAQGEAFDGLDAETLLELALRELHRGGR